MNKRPTLRDIAQMAGVTAMTVSRVINNKGYVSRETREKVERAITELEYRPNLVARSLRTRRTHIIGVILADIANPFTAKLAHGIRSVLDTMGYTAFICPSENSALQEEKSMRALYQHRVDGLIVATRATSRGNQVLRSLAEHLPIVLIGDRGLDHPQIDTVTADHWQGGFEATKHLIEMGHTHIGFIGVSLAHGSGLQRFQGYLDALRKYEIPVREEWILGPPTDSIPGYSTQMEGYRGMRELLKMNKAPTAVFARNDITALGVIQALKEHGLKIPQDMAVVGFDNLPLATMTSPALTTVHQPIEEQGARAAEILVKRLQSRKAASATKVLMNCRLIARESTNRG